MFSVIELTKLKCLSEEPAAGARKIKISHRILGDYVFAASFL
jgi:hypothetical protein